MRMSLLAVVLIGSISGCSSADKAGPQGPPGPTGAIGADRSNRADRSDRGYRSDRATGATGATGSPGAGVTSVVDRITSLAGLSLTSVAVSSLTPLPAWATTRRVTVLNAVLRSGASETLPIVGVFQAFIDPNPVAGAYAVTVWDPLQGTAFPGSALDVVHLYVASYFSL
jgi:hypothetical protein